MTEPSETPVHLDFEVFPARFAEVLGAVADGVTVQDPSGRLVYANEIAARLIGFGTAAELLSTTPEKLARRFELSDASGNPLAVADLPGRSALRGESPEELTIRWRDRETGTVRWLEIRARAIPAAGGPVALAVNTLRDVTEQMKQQQLLERTTSRLVETVEALRVEREEAESARSRAASILESIADPFVVYDAEWRFVYLNDTARRLLADQRGDNRPLDGTTLWESFPAIVGTRLESDMRRAMDQRVPTELEWKNARGGWVSIMAYPTFNGLSVYFRDVTEKKRTQEALAESERRFRELADTSPVLIWMSGADGLRTYLNRHWLDFTGRSMEEEVGDGWAQGVHPDDLERCLTVYRDSFATRRPFEMEYRLRRRDGEYRWILDNGVPRGMDPGGEFQGFIGSCIDITDRRRSEAAQRFLLEASTLLNSTLEYERTLSSIATLCVPQIADWCAVDVRDDTGEMRRLAVAHSDPDRLELARELHEKYPPSHGAPGVPTVLRTGEPELYPEITDEMLAASAKDARHLEMLRGIGFRSAIMAPLLGRVETLGVITFVSSESGRRFDEKDLQLAADLGRRAGSAIENARLFRDVERSREDLQHQARAVEEAAAELEAVNLELTDRTAEAEQANHAKSEFLAMMSHELRTPLNAIDGYAELLEVGIQGELTDGQREYVQRIRASQGHLLGIINDVLNFARLEAGQVHYDVVPVPLDRVFTRVRTLVEPQLVARRIHFRQPEECGTVALADEEKLVQIFLNLLSNAAKFTDPGGEVVTRCESADGEVRVEVCDNGRGIPASRLETIFEPFVQIDPSLTRENSGVGLGLSISRDLARAMGGDLSASSTVGEGSTFVLTLPAA